MKKNGLNYIHKRFQPWTNNWANMSVYFDYSPLIRKMIYTTNTIQSYYRNIRKMTKHRRSDFTSDNALLKLAFLAIQNTIIFFLKSVGLMLNS